MTAVKPYVTMMCLSVVVFCVLRSFIPQYMSIRVEDGCWTLLEKEEETILYCEAGLYWTLIMDASLSVHCMTKEVLFTNFTSMV
jgi:hypothetical protein